MLAIIDRRAVEEGEWEVVINDDLSLEVATREELEGQRIGEGAARGPGESG